MDTIVGPTGAAQCAKAPLLRFRVNSEFPPGAQAIAVTPLRMSMWSHEPLKHSSQVRGTSEGRIWLHMAT